MDRNENQRKYREENREKLKEAQRRYRETHREKRCLYAKKYYQEKRKNDPEYKAKQKAYHAEWQRKNKDRLNAQRRDRRKKEKQEEKP